MSFNGVQRGCVALATDVRDFGGDKHQFLRLDGFALPTHKLEVPSNSASIW